jgi:hypothetical protein
MTDNFRDDARNDDGEFAESWSPKVGDELCGLVKGYRTNVGQYATTVATIADEDSGEDLALWISTGAMVDRFAELKPRVGERLYVRRLPDGHSKASGQSYKRWIIRVDRPETGDPDAMPDFGAYEPSDAPRGTEAAEEGPRTVSRAERPVNEPDDDLPF